MNLDGAVDSASRFAAFVEELTSVIGHADRARPLNDYCAGLLATEGRRSVEPIAAVTAPAEVSVQHQRLLHFVADAPWSDEPVLAKVREMIVPAIERHGPIEAWIIDDTSFPKCGSKSVGVHHQYCGQLGKQANCQVAVTLSIANHHASLPIAYRLYLPQEWAEDAARRKKHVFPKRSRSRLNRRSRWSRYGRRPARRAYRAAQRCWMPVTVRTPRCVPALAPWGSNTWRRSSRPLKYVEPPMVACRSGA